MDGRGATLHYIHDPLCGWCYAAQPLISKARERLGTRLNITLHAGALFASPRKLDAALAQHIVQADERIAEYSGQEFGKPYIEGLLAEHGTLLFSLPPIAALLAAKSIDPNLEYPLLVAIQNAHYQRGLRVAEPTILAELAEDIGLDSARFAAAYVEQDAQALEDHIQASRQLLSDVGGEGFPTFVLERQGERDVLEPHRHFGNPHGFVDALAAMLPTLH
jgi:putative protein-disulfide isomerase